MTNQVNTGLRSADAVVQAFADASVEFDVQVFKAYLDAYPEYGDQLKSYVQVWLMSSRATAEEIVEQVIPADQMLKAQSRLLMVWERAHEAGETQDEEEVAKRLNEFDGEEGLRALSKALLDSEDEEEDTLVMEYLDPGLREEPRRIRKRLADRLRCPPELVQGVLERHRTQNQPHYSAKGKPEVVRLRKWADAVHDLQVSDERKKELLRDD